MKVVRSNISVVRFGLLFIWIVFTVYYAINIYINQSQSTDGERYTQILKEQEYYRLQNKILENQIAYYSSLNHISQVAKQMGFKENLKVEFFKLKSGLNHCHTYYVV